MRTRTQPLPIERLSPFARLVSRLAGRFARGPRIPVRIRSRAPQLLRASEPFSARERSFPGYEPALRTGEDVAIRARLLIDRLARDPAIAPALARKIGLSRPNPRAASARSQPPRILP